MRHRKAADFIADLLIIAAPLAYLLFVIGGIFG